VTSKEAVIDGVPCILYKIPEVVQASKAEHRPARPVSHGPFHPVTTVVTGKLVPGELNNYAAIKKYDAPFGDIADDESGCLSACLSDNRIGHYSRLACPFGALSPETWCSS
jgi:hypothetical protein